MATMWIGGERGCPQKEWIQEQEVHDALGSPDSKGEEEIERGMQNDQDESAL